MLNTLARFALLLALITVYSGCGGGGGGGDDSPATANPPPVNSGVPDTGADDLRTSLEGLGFAELISTADRALARRNPESLVALSLADEFGLAGNELTDISFDYQNVTYDMWQVARDALVQIDRAALTPSEQVSYDIFLWMADNAISEREFIHYDYPATYFLTGVPSGLERFFSDLHPLETRNDVDNYMARLRQVDSKIVQLISNLQEIQDAGIIEPLQTLDVSISRYRGFINGSANSNVYYQSFSRKLQVISGFATGEANDIAAEALQVVTDEIIPAYEDLHSFLQSQRNSAPTAIGFGQFPRGQEYYSQRLRYHTTTDLSAEEIHNLGLQELERIHAELDEHFAALGYPADESLSASFNRVANEGGSVSPGAAVSRYEAIIEIATERAAPLFPRLPEAEVVVIGGNSGGFYIRPALDGSRPGAFYASTTSSQPYYLMPSLAYHEAIPGHHLQIALAQETELPDFRRNLSFTGYVEGWALYTERLAGEEGWYENDVYGDLGRLWFEALRAARLVVDTGIHHFGWSNSQAVSFFQNNVGMSQGTAQSNINRYSIYTGQATAYMVGMLKILELRERMREAQGDSFDLVAFHGLVLEAGAVPLETLEDIVDSAIATQ